MLDKKPIFLIVATLVSSTASPAADTCGPLSSYIVSDVSFDKVPVRDALSFLAKKTPLIVSGQVDGMTVSADNVSGPLDQVLTELAKGAGFQFLHKQCDIKISSLGSSVTWVVRSGMSLREVLVSWTQFAGWQLVWDMADDFALGADARFTGEFDSAVTQLIDAIAQSGELVSVTLYAGNQTVRVSRNQR